MLSLYELGTEIQQIRTAADDIETKGGRNASRIVFIIETCNRLIQMINETSETLSKEENKQEKEEAHGEPDSGSTAPD